MIQQLMRGGLLSDITPRFKYSKIATEGEAASIGGGSGAVSKKCCTKSRAIGLGCQVKGSYKDNQLVQLQDLSKNYTDCTINLDIEFQSDNSFQGPDSFYLETELKRADGTIIYLRDEILLNDDIMQLSIEHTVKTDNNLILRQISLSNYSFESYRKTSLDSGYFNSSTRTFTVSGTFWILW